MDAVSFGNLVSYSAQVALIVALGALLPTLLRLDAPGVRYNYWRGLALFCLALPWVQGRIVRAATAGIASVPDVPIADGTAASQVMAAAPPSASIDWWTIALAVLVGGAVLRLVWIAIGLAHLRRLRHAGELAAPCEEHDELQRMIGTRAEIRYLGEVPQPVTFGVIRPVVLLPSSLRDHPEAVRRAVVAHELLHVERRDWAWVLVEELVRAVFWFHPAVWWLISRVQLAREEVVDQLAVIITGRRRTYVEALLAFADETPLAPAAAFARRRHLFRRMMLISKEAAMSWKRIVASCAAMAVAVALGSWYAVGAFPLVTAGQSTLQKAPGPLEQQAVPITPENPIPRRVAAPAPEYPAELGAQNARGTVTLQLTLDSQGRVAETRLKAIRIRAGENNLDFNNARWDDVESLLAKAGNPEMQVLYDASLQAAMRAVEQWRYDAPYRAPISFPVTLAFAPPGTLGTGGGSVMATGQDPQWTADGALRIGGNIRPPTKIKDVKPIYPPVALAARVSGVVIVEARIGPDGRVTDARILRSIPLLDQAALDAVYQWEFTPTLLNGQAVPVVLTMTVSFRPE